MGGNNRVKMFRAYPAQMPGVSPLLREAGGANSLIPDICLPLHAKRAPPAEKAAQLISHWMKIVASDGLMPLPIYKIKAHCPRVFKLGETLDVS